MTRASLRESAAVQACLIDPEASFRPPHRVRGVHVQIAGVPATDKRPLTGKWQGR